MKYISLGGRVEGSPFPPLDLDSTVVMTVDVEDYYMSPESVPFETWPSYPSAIHEGMERCWSLLEEYGAKATFFFVGWLAERYPELVAQTAEKGHEIATHTYNHDFVSSLDGSRFAASVRRSLEILRSLVPSQSITGCRAPAFSLERAKTWQFDILRENGILYDSSINPHQTYLYGDRSAPRHPYEWRGVVEMPPAAVEIAGARFPAGGGGTLRILPSFYLSWARLRYQAEGFPPVIYIHPWEFVPNHPPLDLPWKQRLIHRIGLYSVEKKTRAILESNRILTMREYYALLKEARRCGTNGLNEDKRSQRME
ncbi:MAG: polysaccharide deacetylase family protein [Candidatus Omnitrophota bacterium]